tara:strand:- start:359 stop:1363 length:1005 start_codon:yes stop_codon:yes gene_type:complete
MARLSNPVPQILDSNGNPSGGAKVYFFEVGTTTPKNTYSDAGLSIANANPVVADSAGRLPSTFLDGNYKVVAKDSDGVTLWTRDPVGETSTGQMNLWVNDQVYNIPELVQGSNDSYYRSLIDNNQGNDPISDAVSWEKLQLGRVWNASIIYAATDSVYFTDGNLYLSLQGTNLNQNPATETAYWNPIGNQAIPDGVPAGAVIAFAMSIEPTGWLECDGSAISRTTYAALFSAIGATFGVGDGSTTFNIPDSRSEIIRGWDNGRGVDAGRAFGSWQNGQIEAHTHSIALRAGTPATAGVAGLGNNADNSSTGITGSTGGAENRMRNVALLYCIKY